MRARPLTATLLVLAGAAAAACVRDPATAVWARGETVAQSLAEQVRAVEPGASVSLESVAPFRWERLFILPAGAAPPAVLDSLGAAWPALARRAPASRPDATRLVFLAGGTVIAAAALPADAARLSGELVGRGYAPAEAVFRVERPRGETPRLVR